MKKYFILIDGEKKFVANKSEADKLLNEAFLSGIQGIDWELYEDDEPQEKLKAGSWFIVYEKMIKQYIKKYGKSCWVSVSRKYVSPYFDTKEEANEAFQTLNLTGAKKSGTDIICYDLINIGVWERYIVQQKTF